jgi:acyl carrier protein
MGLPTVEERVIKIIAEKEKIDAKTITRDSLFEEDFFMDSLEVVELTMLLEEEFNIKTNSDGIKSVDDLIDCIEKELAKKATSIPTS